MTQASVHEFCRPAIAQHPGRSWHGMCGVFSGAALALALAGPALSQDATDAEVAIELTLFKLVEIVAEDGAERIERRAPDEVLPGDRMLYRIDLTNTGDAPAADLVLDLPIPAGLLFAPHSLSSDLAFVASFATQDAPDAFMAFEALTVPAEDGSARPAAAADLGAVRIELAELAGQQTAFVEYEASVR